MLFKMLQNNKLNLENATRNKQAVEFAKQFSDFCNRNSLRNTNDLALISMQDHPTSLQAKMRFCVAFIELMSQRKGDERTEASEIFSKKVVKNTSEHDRCLPLI